jgi:hypothetical protein
MNTVHFKELHMTTELIALTKPLPPLHFKAIKFGLARLFLNTMGRLSEGISIGHAYGFDSGVMLDHVYENKAQGKFLIGRLIDRIYLDAPGWAGIRNRGALLQNVIVEQAHEIVRETGGIRLADLACGGGRYVLSALETLQAQGTKVDATLRDYREENVTKAQANAIKAGVRAVIEPGDAFSDADLRKLAPQNMVIVSGLHEIIDNDPLVEHHFEQVSGLLEKGGCLIVTLQPDHPQVEFIARVLTSHSGRPWAMRLRPVSLIRAWAEKAGFTVEKVTMEPRGIFGVLVARKL